MVTIGFRGLAESSSREPAALGGIVRDSSIALLFALCARVCSRFWFEAWFWRVPRGSEFGAWGVFVLSPETTCAGFKPMDRHFVV